jgi:hypothetical protein
MKRTSKERNGGNYWKGTHKCVIFYMEISVTKRKFLWQEGNSSERKEIPLPEGNSCHRKDIPVIEGNSCHRKEFPVT